MLMSCKLADEGHNPFILRLMGLRALTDAECIILRSLTHCTSDYPAGHTLFFEGSPSDHVCVLISGVAYRYQLLSDGRRQILGFSIPGDLCDLDFLLGRPDYSIGLVTAARVVRIDRAKLLGIIAAYPSIEHALRLAASIDQAVLRQWLLNIGQRRGIERLSHFLCEFTFRMGAIGYSNHDGSLPFRINQAALADTLGMSLVHMNRSMQTLRRAGLVQLRKGTLTILNKQGLAGIASFDPQYLRVRDLAVA